LIEGQLEPEATQLPCTQHELPHWLPLQHGSPGPPQVWHVPLLQAMPPPHSAPPVQQA
jgi:hypothetical protein